MPKTLLSGRSRSSYKRGGFLQTHFFRAPHFERRFNSRSGHFFFSFHWTSSILARRPAKSRSRDREKLPNLCWERSKRKISDFTSKSDISDSEMKVPSPGIEPSTSSHGNSETDFSLVCGAVTILRSLKRGAVYN